MSKLYIVPTPVGNLGDMTPRAVEVLQSVDLILAEDTRTSGVLLKKFDISTHAESHHKWNEHETVARIREKILSGLSVALMVFVLASMALTVKSENNVEEDRKNWEES